MKQSNKTLPAFRAIVLISSLLLGHAQAHHVWIEQDAKEAKLYFGEFGDNLRETSPGLLDRFVRPVAGKISNGALQAVAVSKTSNGFAIASVATKGESLIAQEPAYALRESKDGDKTIRSLYMPAARLVVDSSAQAPQLTLDVVPTGKTDKDQVELQVIFKGKPLPKAKVAFTAASGWMQELRTGDDGKLMVLMPWAGSYVAEVKQADGAGERGAEKYDKANYVTSLTMLQAQGLPALPAPPAAAPNKMN